MNVNEVQGGSLLDGKQTLSPNDDVNKSQSSNDTFPTAMHIAACQILNSVTVPGILKLREVLHQKSVEYMGGGEDRPHSFHGRNASHTGPGALRLRVPARPRHPSAEVIDDGSPA